MNHALNKALLFGALLPLCAPAQNTVNVSWRDSAAVRIDYALSEGDTLGSDYAVRLVPRLTSGEDTLRLSPVVFRGKRNRRYIERARYYKVADPARGEELPAGSRYTHSVELSRQDYPWLWQGEVSCDVERRKEGCCDVMPLAARPLGRFIYVPTLRPSLAIVPDNAGRAGELERDNPVLRHVSRYRPYDHTRVLRKEEGGLYIHFPVGSAAIDRSFCDNAATLDRIVSLTRDIMADTTSMVKIIQIVGLASIEGPAALNNRLAAARANALKQYISARVATPDSLYECANGGEAWTELRDQIADDDSKWREPLLSVIDQEPDPTRRESLIKSLDGGKAYRYLKEEVFNDQRNSGYLRVYYDYVPDSAAHAINAATELLEQERYADALPLLLSAKDDPRAWNALGVALYMTGDEPKALSYFRKAAEAGNPQAKANLRQAEEIKARRQKAEGL